MRRLIGLAVCVAIAGCGGDDDEKKSADAAPAPAAPASLGAAYTQPDVSEVSVSEPAKGAVVATSGFDTTTESFAFPNYGKSQGPNIRPQEMRELFGDGVCIDPAATPCELTPAAERWRQTVNPFGDGGHCYGFSVLSLAIHRGKVSASDYGGDTTQSLRLADDQGQVINDDLHADLGRSQASYHLPTALRRARRHTPTQALAKLRAAFASTDNKDYILAVYMPGEGGHAMVPTGIEDLGGGKFDVLLYDNNYPYVPGNPAYSDRRFKIDTSADTWEYYLSVRPDVPSARWHGQGTTNRIELIPAPANDLPVPCPFCIDAPRATPTTVGLGGDPGKSGHLRITDREGRVTGWDGTRFVNEIPGAVLREQMAIQRELVAPEPFVELPPGGGYTIEQVDRSLGRRAGAVERDRAGHRRRAC